MEVYRGGEVSLEKNLAIEGSRLFLSIANRNLDLDPHTHEAEAPTLGMV